MINYQGYKVVFVVNEYSYGLYKEYCVGEFDTVEEALKHKNSNCKIEVELRSLD